MMDEKQQDSYDEVPYEGYPFPQTHPDRLATLGRLFGLSPAAVTRCRVLELGCGCGGNLIPMAYELPQSEFVGVDLSKRQVEIGRKTIRDLNLENVRIEQTSVLEMDASWGTFDYIIAHGIYSWVSNDVQDAILSVSSTNLAPGGIAYVSYNTYPGWHMREMIRDMMLYHANRFSTPKHRIRAARALIDFLSRSVPTENNLYGSLLKRELNTVRRHRDDFIFHEYLENVNAPIYFHQFMERAAGHGLQYVGEADFGTMLASGFPKEVGETLLRISPDIIETEQYMDFLRNRQFRQTLLCHNHLALKRKLGPENMIGLLVASPAFHKAGSVDLAPGKKETFRTPRKVTLQTDRPIIKAALCVLQEHWPRALDLETLFEQVDKRLADAQVQEETDLKKRRRALMGSLLRGYSSMAIEFFTWQADFVTEVSEKPRVSELTAFLVSQGRPAVNKRHEPIELAPFVKQVVRILDGTRDRVALLQRLGELVAEGTLTIQNQSERGPETSQSIIEQSLDQALTGLARTAFLVA
jgi:methyltransferase-like protein